MKTKNHVKSPTEDTTRGLGKLGYTEGGKMHGTVKRLTGSFDNDDAVSNQKTKKETIVCPGCGKKFKTNHGNIPDHKPGKHYYYYGTEVSGNCPQKKPFNHTPRIVKSVESVEINGYEIRRGDKVAFTTYPWKMAFQDWNDLVEHKVKEVYLMDNDHIYLSLEDVRDEYIPVRMFVKNFIKL